MHQPPKPRSRTIIVLAALDARYPNIAGFFVGALLYSALGAANTNLYISSRTLYGMTRRPGSRFPWLKGLGSVWHRNGVPMVALFVSAVCFMWLPIVAVRGGYSIAEVSIPRFPYGFFVLSKVTAHRVHECQCERELSHRLGFAMPRFRSLLYVVSVAPTFHQHDT